MKNLTVRTEQNVFDGTYTVSLYSEDGVKMISRDFVEESEIFLVEIELTQIANKHGYTVER